MLKDFVLISSEKRRHGTKKAVLSLLCAVYVLTGAFVVPASAQQDVNDRLNRMENDIQTLSRALYRGDDFKGLADDRQGQTASSDSSALQAKLEVRLSQLEIELRSLTGQIEQQSFEIRQMTNNVERMIADIEMRVAALEEAQHISSGRTEAETTEAKERASRDNQSPSGNITSSSSASSDSASSERMVKPVDEKNMALPENPSGSLGKLVVKEDEQGEVQVEKPAAETPSGLYEQAFSLLKNKEYEQSAEYFTMFLDRYPGHNLAANAKYWLGETYYVRNDYERAARVFAEAYQQYADSSKGPDSLLKLGMSLAGMGKKEDACLTYSEIERRYSSGETSILSRARQEKEALGCKSQ